ncbi:hypothetical protein B0T25DRAFT_543642 [Lasiosphaeria hispida]|uniref:Uncharacterized protein n=1 Tax=Lasiosphaeria hispida TaxID=260671 RepID=A0AAJ0HIQ1_9PEZI|nr:hypothetical protein B0T25DRAFT_543642 [Lasiosphaeria hispida]
MAGRYSAEFLLHLRQSPLCIKPPALPPADEWMGPPPEAFRNQPKPTSDRKSATAEGLLLNQENRRPPLDRNGSRSAANPDEIILGPPRTSFASATSARTNRVGGEPEKALKDPERQDRSDRFNFRTRANDSDPATNDRFRDGRDGRNSAFRRRGDQDQDSEGWSTVKPRKSFGAEGAERFHGRMGAAGERFTIRDDRRVRDRDDREVNDRRSRNLVDPNARDTEAEELEVPRNRNSLARAKPEPWSRENPNNGTTSEAPVSQRERIDKAKSWRDRDPNANERHSDRTNERTNERANDRNYDRRWDRERDQRVERDPEWLDEPLEEKSHGHTEEDFKKFMESMKAKQGGAPKHEGKTPMVLDRPNTENLLEPEQKVASAPAIESGPDKFFVAFGGGSLDAATPAASAAAAATENKEAARSKNKKSSRFMTFLTPQEDTRARTEPPTPAATVQHSGPSHEPPAQGETEKEAFAMLIQKLQRSRMEPGMQANAPPQQLLARLMEQSPAQDHRPNSAVASPEPLQGYGGDHREDPRFRGQHDDPRLRQQLPVHTMVSPRPVAPPVQPPPAMRPEQVLQDLLAQRHSFANQANPRAVQNNPPINSNTEFLMKLMQNHRADVPEPLPRMEVRMPQPTKQVSLANIPDRDLDYQRERTILQRQQQMRGQQGPPPGFLEDQFHPSEVDSRPQPTQILQRPPPPGLDHHGIHQFQMGGPGTGGGPLPPPPQRPMIPPPGLVNGPRNVPLPGMYPNFPPPPVFPPEGVMGVPPPGPPNQQQRGMQPPPGFFGGLPPPGFMQQPPPGMGGGFQVQGGLDGPGGFPGAVPPYDRRGMMPPGYRGP